MLDLWLAIAHHLLVFSIFGVLFAEFVVVRPGVTIEAIKRIGGVDAWYGVLAALIIAVGFSRAVFAAKGWDYYAHNSFFWAKIATFALIGGLSIPPTLAFIRWRRSGEAPDDVQVAGVRRFLWLEVALFAPLLAFAAAMARGYGQFH
jgi:putative membrane protein